jgi:cell division protein FtsL
MYIAKKIEEIKSKPEHIRLRYVWFFVFLSMVLVLFVWFFSMKMQMMQFNGSNNETIIDLDTAMSDFNKQSETLKNTVENTKKSLLDEVMAK